MRLPRPTTWWVLAGALALAGCGKPTPGERAERPRDILDFDQLFGRNCAGCHGATGRKGPAPPLNDPLFQAIVSDEDLRTVIKGGREGTLMLGFDRDHGGTLTDPQIEALLSGMRLRWAKPPGVRGPLPSYRPGKSRGDPARGKKLFEVACAGCHGEDGRGEDAGAIHDPNFLALVSDQVLRRFVITGRPDLGMPNFHSSKGRGSKYRPLTDQDVADIVALLASWKKESLPREK